MGTLPGGAAHSDADAAGAAQGAGDAGSSAEEHAAQRREAERRERLRRAVEAYRATVRNEAAPDAPAPRSGAGANDERLLGDRPPHWQPKSPLPPG
ncbi:hypothetical protein GSY69_08315 [Brevibacterium sp. 5221]|uniref:Uncharacterized protein n=1 Tax=Brevibacterium rongguiense TaxID=2695267 RepID=A0A6N9H7G4_9MICO|nr:hypothetical protein [Brevibacterium rongguiense]MYM19970.1 hypothetical protein [Brevibacterium rongguiense]